MTSLEMSYFSLDPHSLKCWMRIRNTNILYAWYVCLSLLLFKGAAREIAINLSDIELKKRACFCFLRSYSTSCSFILFLSHTILSARWQAGAEDASRHKLMHPHISQLFNSCHLLVICYCDLYICANDMCKYCCIIIRKKYFHSIREYGWLA